jgi:hypothetical protein
MADAISTQPSNKRDSTRKSSASVGLDMSTSTQDQGAVDADTNTSTNTMPDGDSSATATSTAASADASADASSDTDASVTVQVRQGTEKFQVVVASPDSTIGDVKQQLLLATAVPVNQMKLIVGGKARDDHESLAACGKASRTKRKVAAMLTFTAKFHDQADGGEYLESAEKELARAEKLIERLRKQIKHRMCDRADATIQISQTTDLLGNLARGLDRVSVPPSALGRKKEVVAQMNRLMQELSNVQEFGLVTER